MSKIIKFYPVLAVIAPLVATAQQGEAINSRIRTVTGTLNFVIALLFVLATVIFLWGVIQFIANSGSEEGRKKAKGIMTWGIIGLAVMAAAWGVAQILVQYFGTPSSGPGFAPPPVNSGGTVQPFTPIN